MIHLSRATIAAFAAALAPGIGHSQTVTEFSAGISVGAGPFAIAAGPDGNLWFTEYPGDRIGRITPQGVVTEFHQGIASGSRLQSITAGPDGAMWFTEANANGIGRITMDGTITQFFDGFANDTGPYCIASGPDGNLWFTDGANIQGFGKMTPSGVVTAYYNLTLFAEPFCIVAGPDGNLWLTESGFDGNARIAKVTTDDDVTEFQTGIPLGSSARYITVGPDGNLWFTMALANLIGRITPDGDVTTYPSASPDPSGITTGPDGNLWVVNFEGTPAVERMAPDGTTTLYSKGLNSYGQLVTIVTGSDGNLWFTEHGIGRIGRLSLTTTEVIFDSGFETH